MSRRVDWRPFAVAAGIGLAAGILGLRPVDALLVSGVVLVLGLVWISLSAGEEHLWPEARLEETDGTRLDVASLTWSFLGRDGRVSEAAVRRLRQVAARRLADHGVHITGTLGRPGSAWQLDGEHVERARELLGERAWRTLSAPGGIMPTVADVAHCIDVIEGLRAPGPRPGPGDSPTPVRTTPEERLHP